jgi:hypothetical protein
MGQTRLVLLYERQDLLDRSGAECASRRGVAQSRKAGRVKRDSQDDAIAMVNQDVRGGRDAEDSELPSEQRMSRLCYLDPFYGRIARVVG